MPEQPPASQTAAQKDPVIYTIPEQFYGVAAKAHLPKDGPLPTASTAIPPSPSTNEPPKLKKESGSKKWILIPVLAVLLLAGMGFAIWWFLRPVPPAQPAQPSVTLPTPQAEPEPEPEPQPEPATTTPETSPQDDSALDSDNDSLTNAEEKLYGTGPLNADTDGDGYSDGLEVTNLYNPTGFKPTKLVEANLVQTYTGSIEGSTQQVSFLYPRGWAYSPGTQDPGLYVNSSDGTYYFSGSAFPNTEKQSVLEVYLRLRADTASSEVQTFKTKSGLEAVLSPNGREAFIALGDDIVVMTSNIGVEGDPDIYRSTFMMFLNSFSKKP